MWLDFISRRTIESGDLKKLVDADGLSGLTSNPTIFEKAISSGQEYDSAILPLAQGQKSAAEIYEALAVEDIRLAAEVLRPVYDRLEGRDGYVSLEVSPRVAHDTEGTLVEAYRLWEAVARPNVFIKIPATAEGLPALHGLLANGVNINVTLLFSLSRYRQVAEAYVAALEERSARRQPLGSVSSVASFFVSRIDTLVDSLLEAKVRAGGAAGQLAASLRGQAAIANAKIAYQVYREVFGTERFGRLAAQGARPQRLLWASTSTKNPAYSDTKYVEALIGPDTINTLPLETLAAYRDHGQPHARLTEAVEQAQATLRQLGEVGVDFPGATAQLETEGVAKFSTSYDSLLTALETKRLALCCEPA